MAGVGPRSGAPDQRFIRDGVDDDRLLHKSVEELAAVARPAPIEPKGEFIEVELQMLVADRPLVGTQDPAFQKGGDAVNPRHQFRWRFLFAFEKRDPMSVPFALGLGIAEPPVGVDGAARLDGFRQKRA